MADWLNYRRCYPYLYILFILGQCEGFAAQNALRRYLPWPLRTTCPDDVENGPTGLTHHSHYLPRISQTNTSLKHQLETSDSDTPVCRIVAESCGAIPADVASGPIFDQIDMIFQAKIYDQTRNITTTIDAMGTIRRLLDEANFVPLSKRDLDLCQALNADYLLRLSIVPEISTLDEGLQKEFYPEHDSDELLFGGRVLVFRRGYAQEVSTGRLLLPKLDYLQANVMQRGAAWLKSRLDGAEAATMDQVQRICRQAAFYRLKLVRWVIKKLPYLSVRRFLRPRIPKVTRQGVTSSSSRSSLFRLSRYGGFRAVPDSSDPLASFVLSTEETNIDNFNKLKCKYDIDASSPLVNGSPRTLLKRVTIGNLVNLFSREGRRTFWDALLARSELVEPTFEEVVVIWRPKAAIDVAKPHIPTLIYELADMFDIEGLLPRPRGPEVVPESAPLQVRSFEGVPMANLLAVMPKTKLLFRPADAFVFDFVSLLSFGLVVGSQRFDSPKLDVLALVSVSLWLLRTVLRYSNKLARYDLLVKTFLTTKISHRDLGAFRYVAAEAGSQRAVRAAIVYEWLCKQKKFEFSKQEINLASHDINKDVISAHLDYEVPINVESALADLESLGLLDLDRQEPLVRKSRAQRTLMATWGDIFSSRD